MSLTISSGFVPTATYTGADSFNGAPAATFCCWVKPTGAPSGSDDYIMVTRDISTNAGMAMKWDSSTQDLQGVIKNTGTNLTLNDPQTITQRGATDWHFVAVSWDGVTGDAFLMIDGEVVDTDNSGGAPDTLSANNNDCAIGSFPGLGSGFIGNGQYANCMTFQRALSATELRALRWNPDAWESDASNITHVKGFDDKIDTGGHANAVTFSGTLASSQAILPPTFINGTTGAHDFDGATDGLIIDVTADPLSARTTYTYLLFHKDDISNADDHLMGTDNGAGTFGPLIQTRNGAATPYAPAGFVRNIVTTSLNLNTNALAGGQEWHHLALSIDLGPANGCKFFVDGVNQAQGTLAVGSGLLSDNNIHIGNAGVTNDFDGQMAWCAGVKAAMTEAEIQDVFINPELLLERSDLHFFVPLDHRGYRDLGPNAFLVDLDTTRPTPSASPPIDFPSGGEYQFLVPNPALHGNGGAAMQMAIAAVGNVGHTGNGGAAMQMAVTATGSNIAKHGDGAVAMQMAIDATGTYAFHHANGNVSITMAVAGVGINAVHRGNGGAAMQMALAATGSNLVHHGDGAVDMTMALAATGSNDTKHGDGAVAMTMAIAAVGINNVKRGDGGVAMTMALSATGQIANGLGGSPIFTPMTSNGEIINGTTISGSPTFPFLTSNGAAFGGSILVLSPNGRRLPKLQATGAIANQNAFNGSPVFPVLQATGTIEGPKLINLPPLEVNGVICGGVILTGTVVLPVLTIDGTISNPSPGLATSTLPKLSSSGTILTGSTIDLSVEIALPKLGVTGTIDPENLISGTLVFPLMTTDPAQDPLAAGSQGDGTVILPILRVDGTIVNAAVLAQTIWALNTESFETTNYTNFDFVSLVSFAEQPYGVTAGGIFLLEGADDDGTRIDAQFLTGIADFGSENLKEARNFYIGYEGGTLLLRVFPDGQVRVREYPIIRQSNSTGVKHARAKGARGLRSRTWQLGVKNQNGTSFDIDAFGMLIRILTRKTRKN